MKPVVVLDAGPLGLLCHTRRSAVTVACEQWLASLLAAGRRVTVPEITDLAEHPTLSRLRGWRAAVYPRRNE